MKNNTSVSKEAYKSAIRLKKLSEQKIEQYNLEQIKLSENLRDFRLNNKKSKLFYFFVLYYATKDIVCSDLERVIRLFIIFPLLVYIVIKFILY
jgi:hypothetical protein